MLKLGRDVHKKKERKIIMTRGGSTGKRYTKPQSVEEEQTVRGYLTSLCRLEQEKVTSVCVRGSPISPPKKIERKSRDGGEGRRESLKEGLTCSALCKKMGARDLIWDAENAGVCFDKGRKGESQFSDCM